VHCVDVVVVRRQQQTIAHRPPTVTTHIVKCRCVAHRCLSKYDFPGGETARCACIHDAKLRNGARRRFMTMFIADRFPFPLQSCVEISTSTRIERRLAAATELSRPRATHVCTVGRTSLGNENVGNITVTDGRTR